jgi:hypothetical protein
MRSAGEDARASESTTARVAAAQAAHEEAQVSLSGSTAAATLSARGIPPEAQFFGLLFY